MNQILRRLKLYFLLVVFSVLLSLNLEANMRKHAKSSNQKTLDVPFFTGPLLTPTSTNAEKRQPAVELALGAFATYGFYNDRWQFESAQSFLTLSPYFDYQFATTQRTGVELQLQLFTNISDGVSSTHFGDIDLFFGYQVANDTEDTWIPDARLMLQIGVPTGKFDRLDPRKAFLQITGIGATYLGPSFSCQKIFRFGNQFFSIHWAFDYLIPLRTRIDGLSLYGGAEDTRGSIVPGQFFDLFIAGEYSLTQKWIVAFEAAFNYQFSSGRFSGASGRLSNGEIATVFLPNSAQLLFLPEFQYNISTNLGMLGGGYFSIAGKNTSAIAGGFVGYVYVF